MVSSKIFVVLLAAAAFTASTCQDVKRSPRILDGVAADTMRRFPHHVTIQPLNFNNLREGMEMCGGSILNHRWILTSIHCVEKGDRLQVDFQKLYKNSTVGSYSVVVNNDETSVFKYPTEYDDIALMKMPLEIMFSDFVKPITISQKSPSQMTKKLAVLPGFNANTNESLNGGQLSYAMLSIVSNGLCSSFYGSQVFDEFLQMCTQSWGNNRNAPCINDYGSGLVVGWPAKPKLMGIYSSTSNDCTESYPSVHTNIGKYESWINSIINDEIEMTTTPTTWLPV